MSSSPNSRSSSPAPSLVSFLSNSVIRTLQRLSSEVTGEDEFNSHRRDVQNSDKNHSYPRSNAPRAPPRQPSPYLPPALSSIILMSSSSNRSLLTEAIAEEIRLLIPARLQLHETWTLMYSLEEHGVSLSTLYQRLGKGAFVFVVRDTSDGIFGAFANESIQPSAGRYYGTGECFLWKASTLSSSSASSLSISNQFSSRTSDNIRFKAFPYSGVNDYMILCDRDFISFGGGDGHYGLWVDGNLDSGVSSTCLTFGNEPLSEEGDKFTILGVEVWRVGPPG
ncbi:oxidation resistance protein 1, variant 2 [Orbilia oligospora]|uniref:Oxidation resistance protein 1 n=1 Tax=Orbilia oligospora TaxID=2813651 RepID=A0A7C8P6I2_ORBOL|nr:oxidation resistance protein 1 [Orbilia oligospora]KAF3172552.1 oxidation resistance protein 1 [Orbilia oligospora]KAF3172553.1 oxidation resistance protein 1, variant 2 [Orbilia oligospora]KAF3236261.1 oxidation resistance protein 1 [Orbilia oligospora]KAF3236262.1 oxidation resistance protein 1, variant 2 [Orbilia oligospora]